METSPDRWLKRAGKLLALGAMAAFVATAASARERVSLDDGWRFRLGDPADVTTNVTYYPEISDLAKLDANEVGTGTNTETYMETLRQDPVATHAGENVSTVQTNFDDSGWRALNLPHDWVVELPFNSGAAADHGFKPVGKASYGTNNIGWYRRTFTLPANDAGQTLTLAFEGVYRNCLVWLNGHILGRNVGGYGGFYFDVTPYANPGGTNVLVVRVDASRFEGWFYEGAGIYRHVWLTAANPVHVGEWGTYVATTSLAGSNAVVTVQTAVTNQSGAATSGGSVTSTIFDANSNAVASVTSPVSVPAGQGLVVTQAVAFTANLWSPQTPYLYRMVSTVSNLNAVADASATSFGVRTVRFDATNGVFINGQQVEIRGMCNHQDHAGVGSALPDRLQYFRIERLKQMGVTGYRTSHNPPTPALLDACDQLGMLVLDETRRLGTNAEPLGELSRLIRRDRNHPSVFAWSLANEENAVQGNATGAAVIQVMQNLVHSLDSTRLCTAGMNGSWGSGFSTVLDVQGFNYYLGNMDGFHSSHPGQPSIGTETASTVTTRGIYTNDTTAGYCASYDIQNGGVGWGSPAEVWWPHYHARPWASGGFCWTGFDYRGEPTPYGWPCISSHFGIMDTCGFAKDLFYYYQANWTDKPVLHLFPHWNWNTIGQPINVWVYGNCQSVELFLNGQSLGRQNLNVQGHLAWTVPYAPGTLQAVGYNHGVATITNTVETTGAPAAVSLRPDRSTILADGRDVSIVTVAVLDSQGRVVPTATNLVNFAVTGGSIIGVGNGNPSSHEADKASQRQVFNGLAQVIVQSTNQAGTISLTATSTGLTTTNVFIAEAATLPPVAAPTGVVAVGSDAQVTVSWDVVPGATTYNLWRATNSGGAYTLIAGGLGPINLGYSDTDVTNQTAYYYVVTANGNGTSGNSAEVSATPGAFVTSLTATASSSQIALSWSGVAGASYNVKRAPVVGGPYTTIASAIADTNYTDAGAVTCQPYYYVVTITNAGYESLNSPEASAEIMEPIPGQFTSADIGSVGQGGSALFCSGQFSIAGSGADIWGNSDAFQFVYIYLPDGTNCDLRARVASVQNTSSNAKAAVMIRESLAAGSVHALVDVEPSAGIEFLRRTNTGGSTYVSSVAGTAPAWVRLTRTNNNFRAYTSADGNTWTPIGSAVSITMSNGVYAGLAVCAHNNAVLNTSTFDNFSLVSSSVTNSAPVITSQPANQSGPAGTNVSFSVAAFGSPTLAYQWLKNGTPLANTGSVSGADTATLNLTGTTTNDAGGYSVVIANALGSVTSSVAALTVLVPSPPATPQNLTATAVSAGWINVNWTAVPNATGYRLTRNGTVNLPVAGTSYADTGLAANSNYCYAVVATNVAGSSIASADACTTTLAAGVVFHDGFHYAAGGSLAPYQAYGWTTGNVGTKGMGNNYPATPDFYWGNSCNLEYDLTNVLAAGDVLTMDADIDPSRLTYPYIRQIILWDGMNAGTRVTVAAVTNTSGPATLTQLAYTNTSANAGWQVAYWYGHGANWGQTFDVTFGYYPAAYTLPPAISSVSWLAGSGLSVSGTGSIGQTFIFLAASNLTPPVVWTSLATNLASTNGLFNFTDAQATNYENRFYRIMTP